MDAGTQPLQQRPPLEPLLQQGDFTAILTVLFAFIVIASMILIPSSSPNLKTILTILHQVPEGHVGVYWLGGALQKMTTTPGFHLKLPLITHYEPIQVTLQTDLMSLVPNDTILVRDIPCGTKGGVMINFDRIERPSAKELLKHRFIRSARKNLRLLERIRERPKFHIKEDDESPRNGTQASGEGSNTVKVTREPRVKETVRASGQGKTMRSAGWDFSIGGSGSTGTVRSAVRPPQIRDRKTDTQATQKRNMETSTRRFSEASRRDSRESDQDKNQDYYKGDEDMSMDVTGIVVVRSPRAQTSSLFSDQSTMSSSTFSSVEDASISGTFVYRGSHDELDSPCTPNSRLGIQEKTSSASHEDSALNLAEVQKSLKLKMEAQSIKVRPTSAVIYVILRVVKL